MRASTHGHTNRSPLLWRGECVIPAKRSAEPGSREAARDPGSNNPIQNKFWRIVTSGTTHRHLELLMLRCEQREPRSMAARTKTPPLPLGEVKTCAQVLGEGPLLSSGSSADGTKSPASPTLLPKGRRENFRPHADPQDAWTASPRSHIKSASVQIFA